MPAPPQRLQPSSYHAFHCLGAECEDTCCVGWIVNIDKPTYESYQRCDDPELGPRLHELVTINPASANDDSYARFLLSGSGCPFLSDGLCGIQNKLGEQYLSIMCSQFPRVMSMVDDICERSLDMSCPEAARVMLLDPKPMEFDDIEGPVHDPRIGHLSTLRTTDGDARKPYRYFHEIRAFVIWLLQYRADPLWKRLVILGSFCDELNALAAAGAHAQIPELLVNCRDAVTGDVFGEALLAHSARPTVQLELVLDLIVARITTDFTHPRFLACYQEFKEGIDWTSQSTMEEIGQRYAAAHAGHYAPFLSANEHMLEHYVVNYVYRTLFPLGPQETKRGPGAHHVEQSIRENGLLMLVHYAMIQTLLIGMAAFHKEEMSPAHAIRAIQSFAKAFDHSVSFPAQALRILGAAGMDTCVKLALTVRH